MCAGRDVRDFLAYCSSEWDPERINGLPEVIEVKINETGLMESVYDVGSWKEHHSHGNNHKKFQYTNSEVSWTYQSTEVTGKSINLKSKERQVPPRSNETQALVYRGRPTGE